MTYRSIVLDAEKILKNSGVDDPRNDAIKILLNILDITMSEYLNDEDKNLEDIYDFNTIRNINIKYDKYLSLREKRCPLQYILGEAYFYGLRFEIDNNVLIPRSDTETLVETVLDENNNKNINVLDMCTGSGCIAIALSKYGKYKNIIASDISKEALNIAGHNAKMILDDDYDDEKSNIYFVESDMFDNLNIVKDKLGIEKYDVITINPPYIRSKDLKALMPEVYEYEPLIALDGDKDGLIFYKKIAKEAKKYMNDDSKIYMEIGFDQANDVREIFEKEDYKNINIIKDLSGNDRVVKVSNI